MKAEVTYNAGKTYRIKKYKFEKGKTKTITDAAVIKKCQQTTGFSVRVLEEDKPKKKKGKSRKVRPVERAPKLPAPTSKSKDKGKSKKDK